MKKLSQQSSDAARVKTVISLLLICLLGNVTCCAQHSFAQLPESVSYAERPFMFEANRGQADSQVQFVSRSGGYSLNLCQGKFLLAFASDVSDASSNFLAARRGRLADPLLHGHTRPEPKRATSVTIDLVGASRNSIVMGEEALPAKINYFLGQDATQWVRNVPTYRKVRYREIYPGIDLVYYGNRHEMEFDFDLAPGADPTQIQFAVEDGDALSIDDSGNLVISKDDSQVRFQPPQIYQQVAGGRERVDGAYVLRDAKRVGFEVGRYNRSEPLVIDPVLVYSTFMGGASNDDDYSNGIAVDSSGDAYEIGWASSLTIGSIQSDISSKLTMFLAKLDPTGANLLFLDYFGGSSGEDSASGITLDSAGNPYVTGVTYSSDFPVSNAFQPTLAGSQDAFLTKFSADGSSIVYSTYLGGSNLTVIGWSTEQQGYSVAVDSIGEAVIAGVTAAKDFPTANAYQPSVQPDEFGDWGIYGFVTKFSADGTSLIYSTYLAGSHLNAVSWPGCFPDSEMYDVATDPSGNAYVTGITITSDFPVTGGSFDTTYPGYAVSDVGFVAKLTASGSLAYATYLSGHTAGMLRGIAVGTDGSAYVTGYDQADDQFPIVTTSICDPSITACNGTIIAKLDPTGSFLEYSTFLGVNSMVGQAIQIDAQGDAFITGSATSFGMVNPIQGYAGSGDVVVAEIDPTASTILMATFLGGQGLDVTNGFAVDSKGAVYVTGNTQSSDFPATPGAFQTSISGVNDTFIAKIDPATSAAAPVMSPSFVEFPAVTIATRSELTTATVLRNMGSQALFLNGRITGDFAETDDCKHQLAPASYCTFHITFHPTAPGHRRGALIINNDSHDGWRERSVALPLNGWGVIGCGTSLFPNECQ